MGFISWIKGEPSKAKPVCFDLHAQLALEAEGAEAGLAGKTRADCPYDKETQSREWNHWVYGCETAAGEKKIIASGVVNFCTTDPNVKPWNVDLMHAVATGQWRPRFAPLPEIPGVSVVPRAGVGAK